MLHWLTDSISGASVPASGSSNSAFACILFTCALCTLVYFLWVSGLACPGCAYLRLTRRLKLWFLLLFTLALIVSVAMELVREYYRQLELLQTGCSRWSSVTGFVKGLFSWRSESSQLACSVSPLSPLWRVSPLRVLLLGLQDLLVIPVETVSEAAGRGLTAFMTNVPLLWQPVILVALVFLCCVSLFCRFGYQFRSPLAHLGPTGPMVAASRGADNDARGSESLCSLCFRRRQRIQRPLRIQGRRV